MLGRSHGFAFKTIGAALGVSDEGARYTAEIATKKLRRKMLADLKRVAWCGPITPSAPLPCVFGRSRGFAVAASLHYERLFRDEFAVYRREGIGLFYRSRVQPTMSRSLIAHNRLYVEPSWTKHKKTGYCICVKCCPLGFGFKRDADHAAKLETFERTASGWSPAGEAPTLIALALGYGSGVEKDKEKDEKRRRGKRWLYTYNGYKDIKPKPKPRKKSIHLVPFRGGMLAEERRGLVIVARDFGLKIPSEGKAIVSPRLRHVGRKGVPLATPVASYFAPEPKRKAPVLPPDLRFLSPVGVQEWRKAALKTYHRKERRKKWTTPTILTFASLCCSTDASLTQSKPQPATSTRSHPPTSATRCGKVSRRTE